MKKSKILAISLSTIGLTGISVITPIIMSSCTTQTSSEDIINYLIGEKAIAEFHEGGYKLSREPNTNNYTLQVPGKTWNWKQGRDIWLSRYITEIVSKEKLIEWGFDENFIPKRGSGDPDKVMLAQFGVITNSGKIKYPGFDFVDDNDIDIQKEYTEPKQIFSTIRIYQLITSKLPNFRNITPDNQNHDEYANGVEKYVTLNFKLTIQPTK